MRIKWVLLVVLLGCCSPALAAPAPAAPQTPSGDSLAIGGQKVVAETTTVAKPSAPDSLGQHAENSKISFITRLKNWAKTVYRWSITSEGFITFVVALAGFLVWIFRIMRTRLHRRRSQPTTDKRPPLERYLDHMLEKHRNLPVAGFETNLRIPIPLEKVFVTLRARLTELGHWHVGSARHKTAAVEPESLPDRDVTAQQALRYALEKHYHGLVILGHPGSGKTTLVKYFLLCFATDRAKANLDFGDKLLPVLLYLRQVDPEQSLLANLLCSFEDYDLRLDEQFFREYLLAGKAILLLDGLDEVSSEDKRHAVSQWIHHQAHLTYPQCPLLVTSRFSGYRGEAVLPGNYLRLEIQDYNMTEIRQFLQNWLTAVETHLHEDNKYWRIEAKTQANDLGNRIEQAPALRDLAVNPLMLQIIALVHRDRGTLPERRVELYKECTDVLLERWDKAKGLDLLLSAAQARQLLQPVALWIHSVENRREVSKVELLDYITPLVPRIKKEVDLEELLQSWRERSGIFKGEGDTYFFHHLSFQEYLTAEEIRNTRNVDTLVRHFGQSWWREPTLLAMGFTNPPIFADFMAALLRANRRDGGGTDFLLRCVDEALVKDETPFVEALRRLRRFEARYQALLALARIGTEAAKVAVRAAADNDDEHLADTAHGILARWGEVLRVEREIVRGKEIIHIERIPDEKTKLPARLFNPLEQNAEYLLIPGAPKKHIFQSTGKPAPDYPLYFAKYPVTNKLYRRFIAYLEGKSKEEPLCALPLKHFADSLLITVAKEKDFIEFLGNDPHGWAAKLRSAYEANKRFNGDDQPVMGVTWYVAAAYSHWLTFLQTAESSVARSRLIRDTEYRLPTEEEWEWAAGGGSRKYPWGTPEPDASRANYDQKVGQTTPVGAYPAGATPEGLMDMAGNAWEWMANLYGKGAHRENARALRGGSWYNFTVYLRCSERYNDGPGWSYLYGFRIVCSQSGF